MNTFRTITLSLILHAILLFALFYLPNVRFPNRTQQDIEIVYQNEKPRLKGLVYEDYSQEEEKDMELLKKKVKNLSRIARRVEKEIQARNLGRSQNLKPSPPSLNDRLQEDLAPRKGPRVQTQNNEQSNTPSIERPADAQGVGRNLRQGDSSISRLIPEVEIGSFSSLNSDQFVYYTFYARTNEQVRNRWVENLRNVIAKSSPREINRIAGREQTSRLEILLNPKGEFIKALIHQKSQSQELDESAVSALRMASPLNNPPEEMVAADGYIHLHYIFTLYFKPRYIASGSK